MEINSNEIDVDISYWVDIVVLLVGYLFDVNFCNI